MIGYLRAYFRPESATPGASLAINGGVGGARLTHNHERQYHYVLQSLTLWREISHEVRAASVPAAWPSNNLSAFKRAIPSSPETPT